MNNASHEISNELDIVRLVRRLRSYGIALYYLTSQRQKTIISRMAAYKPLRNECKLSKQSSAWATIHNQSFNDRFMYNFYKRYAD